MPDLRQLRAFVAVAEELNFTRAAERLFVAQQAVSRSVAQLERELDVTLLERTTHTVALTPAGATLLASGRKVLAAADAAFAQTRSVAHGLTGTVRLGLTPAIGPHVRAEVVHVLREGAPDVSVSIHELRPADVAQVLRDRIVDLALARSTPRADEVSSAPLRSTPAMLLVPAGHRFAGLPQVRLADLDGERLLTWSPLGTPYTDLIITRMAAGGADMEAVQSRVTGGFELPDLVDANAVALVPIGWPPGEDLVAVSLAEPVDLPLLVLWPAGTQSAPVRRLRARMPSVPEHRGADHLRP